mmetsp:Transcript_29500/g.63249  ORF Transcript_29500/g.63249 Transcript_29500/m.63249 type:complete len:217 (+) Transcript_29500:778-1428(+)
MIADPENPRLPPVRHSMPASRLQDCSVVVAYNIEHQSQGQNNGEAGNDRAERDPFVQKVDQRFAPTKDKDLYRQHDETGEQGPQHQFRDGENLSYHEGREIRDLVQESHCRKARDRHRHAIRFGFFAAGNLARGDRFCLGFHNNGSIPRSVGWYRNGNAGRTNESRRSTKSIVARFVWLHLGWVVTTPLWQDIALLVLLAPPSSFLELHLDTKPGG